MKLIFCLLFSLSLAAETIQVLVPTMVCQACVQSMKKHFTPYVKNPETDINVDLKKKIVTINTTEKMSDKKIKLTVRNAKYQAVKITRLK